MNGILLVDKPSGWTSFDVVNKVRFMVQRSELNTSRKKRFPVGHTGTLDPLATGLLVLLLGDYTKRAPALSKVEKSYDATMKLGFESTTGDEEGQQTFISAREPELAEITKAFAGFTGKISQTPPAFSAVKVDGQRAYKLARAGKPVELAPRPVTIHELTVHNYSYPTISFTTKVSSGTYIRSLIEDIGGELGTGAYMTSLRRTAVGQFSLSDAVAIDDTNILSHVMTLDE